MNFFKSGLQSVLGTAEIQEQQSGAETVSEIQIFENLFPNFFYLFRLRDLLTEFNHQHCWKIGEMHVERLKHFRRSTELKLELKR